jgi:NADPH-dependent 2,4-dienoyl-CoA reductase/sulfur reductase-like enzyme
MRPDTETASLDFEGEAIECWRSDTIASALIAAGRWPGRTSADGAPRSVFCGMGVCQECLVSVDGGAPSRACMTPVRDGMRVARQAPRRDPEPAPPLPERELRPELAVIGGGPAGLAAAAAAAERGVEVLLVDERSRLGGQYYKQPADSLIAEESRLDAQFRAGRELAARARAAGVEILGGAEVWGAFAPDHLVAAAAEARYSLRPRALLLATGAYERAVPFPGWTLPGVTTTGAAQTLLRAYQVAPGERVLVSGNGPLNLQVAAELCEAGVEVVAVAELAAATSPRRAGAALRMALASPGLARRGIGYGAALWRRGVPLLAGSTVIRAEGEEAVSRAVVAKVGAAGRPRPGSERAFEVDAVCVGFGFLPSNEISRALGCEHAFDPAAGHLRVVADSRGRTSLAGVWAVGDGAGIGGAPLAEARGELAGADVAASLRGAVAAPSRPGRAAARSARFQAALWELYAAPPMLDQLAAPETLVCRCEGVSLAQAEAALGEGVGQIGALKRVTRAGMGGCQGRYCGPVLAGIAARHGSTELSERDLFAPAAPIKPATISTIAAPEPPRREAKEER